MKIRIATGFCLALLAATAAMAQSPFDGTWKIEVDTAQLPKKPDVYLLQGGMYACKSCVPAVNVKADGEAQKVTGHPYFDSMSVKVVDDRSIEEKEWKNGKVVATSTTTVSADGKTAKVEFSDSTATTGAAVTGKGEMKRVAAAPAGSHAISGSWVSTKLESMSDNGLLFTYKVEGDTLNMSTPTDQSYSAKLDGTEAPYTGDPGTTSVSIKAAGKNAFDETDKRDGKVTSVSVTTVSANGKTMTITIDDKVHGTTLKFTADKQ